MSTDATVEVSPHSATAAYIVERNYRDLGVDKWDSRKVYLLCAKLGDTPTVLAARLRLVPSVLQKKLETDVWSKQDRLLLTIIEREVDALKGGIEPTGKLVQ